MWSCLARHGNCEKYGEGGRAETRARRALEGREVEKTGTADDQGGTDVRVDIGDSIRRANIDGGHSIVVAGSSLLGKVRACANTCHKSGW